MLRERILCFIVYSLFFAPFSRADVSRQTRFCLRGSYFDRARSVSVNRWTTSNSILVKRNIGIRTFRFRIRRIRRQKAFKTHYTK